MPLRSARAHGAGAMATRPLLRPTLLSPTREPVALAAVPTGPASPVGGGAYPLALVPNAALSRRAARLLRFAGIELAIWAAFYGAYLSVRSLTIGSRDAALGHAADVVSLERTVGLFRESAIQSSLHAAAGFFSAYYMLGFAPLIVAVLVWLGLRRPELYRELRTALLVSIALATVVFVLFPTAPPRLVDGLGITDTVGLSDHDTGSFLGIRFNPYAAVPSMHVGWSLLLAIFGFRAARRRFVRALCVLHPALMVVTVTATGNHYLFDAVAGAAVACVTLWLLRIRRVPLAAPSLRLAAPPTLSPFPLQDALERKAA
jgi:PAP2 superfamily